MSHPVRQLIMMGNRFHKLSVQYWILKVILDLPFLLGAWELIFISLKVSNDFGLFRVYCFFI